MNAPLPPCGCKRGCEHREHPQFPAQRECRLGYDRRQLRERGKTRPCELSEPHGLHIWPTGEICQGFGTAAAPVSAAAPESDLQAAMDDMIRSMTSGMIRMSQAMQHAVAAIQAASQPPAVTPPDPDTTNTTTNGDDDGGQ
jgi:hypothetical protein